MRTIDGLQTTRNGFVRRVWRDIAVIWRLTRQALNYFVVGGRVRRAYRANCKRGETYWLDTGSKP